SACHKRMVLSLPADRICRSDGEKATLRTVSVWPVNRRSSCPLWVSHKRTVLSKLPDKAQRGRPSGPFSCENATLVTMLLWPRSFLTTCCASTSHKMTESSVELER